MKILLGIEGGAGKGIAATGAVRIATELGHQVDVITAWPQIWEGNPHVNRVYEWAKSEYLFEKVKEYDKVVLNDPYRQSGFLLGNLDLTASYNYILNEIEDSVKPELWLNKAETIQVKELLADVKKPILVVQTNGGQANNYSWTRDLPLEEAVQVLNEFQEEYEIIHLRSANQPEITGVKHTAELSIRQAIVVLSISKKRLLIDSVYQHAAAALDLDSVVLWVMTEESKFGHKQHINIQANQPELKNTDRLELLFKGLDASTDKCPFAAEQAIFDTAKIIKALKDKK